MKIFKMPEIKILSTKRLTEAERKKLSNFYLVDKDFIQIELLDFQLINVSFDLLLFTSKNAVASVLKNEKRGLLKKIKCICVGENTKKLLEKNGFEVLDFAHYAEDLTQLIKNKYKDRSFAFFCGNLRRNVLPNFFNEKNIQFKEIQVYKNELSPKKIEEKFDAFLFFSPSAVHSFVQQNEISDQICFCIGTTTAEALKPMTKNIILSEKPTVLSVLQKVNQYYL